jgi:hypothetical protein
MLVCTAAKSHVPKFMHTTSLYVWRSPVVTGQGLEPPLVLWKWVLEGEGGGIGKTGPNETIGDQNHCIAMVWYSILCMLKTLRLCRVGFPLTCTLFDFVVIEDLATGSTAD